MKTPPQVLIVEDDDSARKVMAFVLARSYGVATAPDGEAALLLLEADRPDVVVTDIFMPNMDGLELARRTRALPATLDTPFVFVTAARDEAWVRTHMVPGDAFVSKPFDLTALAEAVARVLEERPQE